MTDDELFDLVRAAYVSHDPVPGHIYAAARRAFAHRTRGARRIEPVEADRMLADVRGEHPRLLRFAGADMAVEVEVTDTGDAMDLAGRLRPATPAHVRARHPGGALETRADPAGQFALTVPPGLLSLLFRLPDGGSIVTSWIRL